MMPAKPDERQYRMMAVPLIAPQGAERPANRFESEFYVEGYASTFDDPYTLFEDEDGWRYVEIVEPTAFANADMSDVIMQYDHDGQVYARQSNGTLVVEPDAHGLFVAADLSRTTLSRQMWEQVESGLVTRMSWAFTIADETVERDEANKVLTSRITAVRKVFDVSAVSRPADPNTAISARALFDGEIEARRLRESERRGRSRLLMEMRARTIDMERH